ncbi:MAG: sterol desaturase family protein [Flavobacteriaceae bacterium]|nr:sterol desaturase family protein [Flavobacteriaceae bacterium]PCH83198.1 MAG: Sterol desaturase [Piscirickettsiaceae bacterium]
MFEIDPLLKPILIAAVFGLLWVLESAYPMFRFKGGKLKHDSSNIALGIMNAVIAGFVFATLVLTVTTWAMEHQIGLLNWLELPSAIELIIGLTLFDCWQYCWHRINHMVPFFWRFHAVHHSDAAMDASSAVRFHTIEILYSSTIRLLILPLIGLSIEHLLVYELILLPIILFHHSNIAIRAKLDKVLRVFIVTPRIHWVHHSHIREETDSNYASLLSVWDRLFGSFRLREDTQNIRFGLGDSFDNSPWDRLGGMLKQPLNSKLYKQSTPLTDDS